VGVDGNGDGNTKDNDLTKTQVQTLARDFRTFISAHNGGDLSKSGAEVFGDGAQSDKGNFVRAVSQFVGSAGGGWNGVGIQMTDSASMRSMTGDTTIDSSTRGYFFPHDANKAVLVNADSQSTFTSGGNAARTLIHERLHDTWGTALSKGVHRALDAEARRLLTTYGLGSGGCESVGGWFGTDFGARYPGCK
jgi:hypothetical protein